MTSNGDIALSALYAVLNMMISIICGIILYFLGVLTPTTRQVLSAVNFYVLVPTYGWIYIFNAISRNTLNEFGIMMFTLMMTFVFGFILVLSIVFCMNSDCRGRFAFAFVIVYSNAVVMPQMLAQSTCGAGNKYASTFVCKNGMVKPYSSLPFIPINILYWVTVLPMLQYEKQMSQNIKKILAVTLNYYETLQAFLSDEDFANRVIPKFSIGAAKDGKGEKEKGFSSLSQKIIEPSTPDFRETDLALNAGGQPIQFTDARFIKEFYQVINKTQYDEITKKYEEFYNNKLIPLANGEEEEKLAQIDPKRKETQACYTLIKNSVLEPEKLLDNPLKDDLCSLDFYYRRIIKSPPALWSLIGLICGFIFPFRDWFFDPKNNPLPSFIASVQSIANMMSPVSMFLLGTYLAQASYITPDLLIQWKHIFISNFIRNLCLPLIGFFWMFVVIRGLDETMFRSNPVLMMMLYCLWMVPNGIVLIGVYVVADYYAKEFAVISVYLNLIAIPCMAIYLIIYFILYDSYVPESVK